MTFTENIDKPQVKQEFLADAPSFMENPTFKKPFYYSEKHHNFCDLLPYYQTDNI